MYRGSCSCQAIQYEIDHIGELDADDETLSHSDETHHVCNICGSVIFVERGSNQVSVEVTFSGHDVLAESHCQFVF